MHILYHITLPEKDTFKSYAQRAVSGYFALF